MRDDMHKVLVERPRRGHGLCYRNVRHKRCRFGGGIDDPPLAQGMRRPHRLAGEWKELNENLAPLRRFLERQVGRPWNAVFAELAAGIDRRSTVQAHIHQHLDDFVARAVARDAAGRLSHLSRPFWCGSEVRGLYVDPDDGRIRSTPPLPRRGRATAPAPDRHRVRPDLGYRKLDGIWYAISYQPIPTPRSERRVAADGSARIVMVEDGKAFDILDGWVTWRRAGSYPPAEERTHVAVAKRQLSRAELRQAGLRNDPRGRFLSR